MQIGITGGIGAGKSFICRVFKVLGTPIYNADTNAKMLMTENLEIINEIKAVFGEDSYLENGKLNRAYLANQIFKDQNKLTRMNEIVHPRVDEHYENWVKIELQKHPYVVKEAALMFSNGSYKKMDKVIVVNASSEKRIQRVIKRDHRTPSQIAEIIGKQKKEEELFNLADITINNDDSTLLIPQIIELHKSFSLVEH